MNIMDILKQTIKELEAKNKELEDTIKKLTWNSYHYRLKQIYDFFNNYGIKKTAKQFDMPIIDVINFIIECDDDESSITCAHDYTECYIELYGLNEDE